MHRHEWDATPTIGSSARIMRGFSRIGVGAAALTAVLGLAITVSVAFNDYKSATQWPGTPVGNFDPAAYGAKPFDPDEFLAQTAPEVVKRPPKTGMFDDLIPPPKGRLLSDAEVGLAPQHSGPFGWFLNLNAEAFSSAALTVAIGLGITGAACLAVFGFFSGLGWIIAGFARD
jgi:hypothetical protein